MIIDLEKEKHKRIRKKLLENATGQDIKEAEESLEYTYMNRKKIKRIQDEIDKLGL